MKKRHETRPHHIEYIKYLSADIDPSDVRCECGFVISKQYLERQFDTLKHKRILEKIEYQFKNLCN